jgi:hypothetical protein
VLKNCDFYESSLLGAGTILKIATKEISTIHQFGSMKFNLGEEPVRVKRGNRCGMIRSVSDGIFSQNGWNHVFTLMDKNSRLIIDGALCRF